MIHDTICVGGPDYRLDTKILFAFKAVLCCLFHAWLDCLMLLQLGAVEVYALGMFLGAPFDNRV